MLLMGRRAQPVSKELVENAIDAGSTQITIEVEESGLSKFKSQTMVKEWLKLMWP